MDLRRMKAATVTELQHHAECEVAYWQSVEAGDENSDSTTQEDRFAIAEALGGLAFGQGTGAVEALAKPLRELAIKSLYQRLLDMEDVSGKEPAAAVRRWAETLDPTLFPRVNRMTPSPGVKVPDIDGYFKYDDGGRSAAGYKGSAGDCVCRSIAIATQQPYQTVYDALKEAAQHERPRGRTRAGNPRRKSSVRDGVRRPTIRRYMDSLGWTWTPTMGIGTGCMVHLKKVELPPGRLVVSVSKHLVAVIDGVIHDTYDPSREGTRCVYGYWKAPQQVTA